MSSTTRVGAAVAAGYFLGRFKKLRLALMVGSALANEDVRGRGLGLLQQGTQSLGASPEVKKLSDKVTAQLMEAGKAAAISAAVGRIDSLSDRLNERSSELRGITSAPGQEDEDHAADESDEEEFGDEEPEDLAEDEESEDEEPEDLAEDEESEEAEYEDEEPEDLAEDEESEEDQEESDEEEPEDLAEDEESEDEEPEDLAEDEEPEEAPAPRKKPAAKKSASKKSAPKKSTSKQPASEKSAAKKSPAKKSSSRRGRASSPAGRG